MINANSFSGDFNIGKSYDTKLAKVEAIDNLLELLSQIDYKLETVPFDNLERFTRLLISLKGEPLNEIESELIKEFTNYRKSSFKALS